MDLAKWLGEKGYSDPHAVEDAAMRGASAANDLTEAEELSHLPSHYAQTNAPPVW